MANRRAGASRLARVGGAALLALATATATPAQSADAPASGVVDPAQVGDAIPQALTSTPGDAARGRAIVTHRRVGLCLLCHSGPFPEERFQGNLAPDLRSAARLNEGQIRARIVDPRKSNPESIMPAYFETSGRTRVAPSFKDKTILSAEQIEDIVAYLMTLR